MCEGQWYSSGHSLLLVTFELYCILCASPSFCRGKECNEVATILLNTARDRYAIFFRPITRREKSGRLWEGKERTFELQRSAADGRGFFFHAVCRPRPVNECVYFAVCRPWAANECTWSIQKWISPISLNVFVHLKYVFSFLNRKLKAPERSCRSKTHRVKTSIHFALTRRAFLDSQFSSKIIAYLSTLEWRKFNCCIINHWFRFEIIYYFLNISIFTPRNPSC
jgi:hypothetical protein